MGDVYYVKGFWKNSDGSYLRIPSELVQEYADKILKLTNTTCGLWFYEGQVMQNPEVLRAELQALADEAIDRYFEQPYNYLGKRRLT